VLIKTSIINKTEYDRLKNLGREPSRPAQWTALLYPSNFFDLSVEKQEVTLVNLISDIIIARLFTAFSRHKPLQFFPFVPHIPRYLFRDRSSAVCANRAQ